MPISIPKFSAYGPLFREYASIAERGEVAPKLARSIRRALESADKQTVSMQRLVSRRTPTLADRAVGDSLVRHLDDAHFNMTSIIADIPVGKPRHFDARAIASRLASVADAFTAADDVVRSGRGIATPALPSAPSSGLRDAVRGVSSLVDDAAGVRSARMPMSVPVREPWLGTAFSRIAGSRVMQRLTRTKVIGADNMPARGGVVIAATHTGAGDLVTTLFGHQRTPRIMAHASLMKHPVSRAVLERAGAFPVEPGNARAGMEMMEQMLRQGEAVKIYPEGMLTRVDRLAPAREGAALAAIRTRSPVVVVGEYGTRPAHVYGEGALTHWAHRGGRGAIAYSRPIETAHLDPRNRDHVTALTALIGDEQARLREVARRAVTS